MSPGSGRIRQWFFFGYKNKCEGERRYLLCDKVNYQFISALFVFFFVILTIKYHLKQNHEARLLCESGTTG